MATEDVALAFGGTNSRSGANGIKVTTNQACTLIEIVMGGGANATTWQVGTSQGGSETASGSMSGSTSGAISVALAASTTYWITCDSNGSSYTQSFTTGSTAFPYAFTNTNWVAATINESETTANISMIDYIVFQDPSVPDFHTDVRVGGVWKQSERGQVRVGGTWKNITKIQARVGGTWKNVTTT